MATKEATPPLPSDTEGAGTTAALPGAPDFDIDNASPEDYAKHVEILRRRAEVAGLTPTPLVALSATAAPDGYASAPTPAEQGITKIDRRNGNPQTLPAKAWALLPAEDLAEFEDQPAKPASTL